ncbi:MAG: insulinase family protein [Bdellovibrionota bacterium]
MKAAKVMEQLFKRSNIYFLALIMVAFSPLANAKPINVNQKLPNDKREYRAIKLDNKLEALLISDVALNKSAAALDVNAGSIRDPLDKQGLAHFLEHVLFLGTKTYPEPDEFITFVEQHRGKWNAFTAPESTNYHFDINHDGLEGALKRFSLFFIEPTFNKNFITKERNAVHSEFKKNLDNDSSRIYRVYQELIIKDHPARGFAVGNNETLAKVGGKELLDFYKKYYSANIMKLVIMSNKSLDDQEKLVKQYFSPIKNYNVKLDKIPTKIIDNKNLPSEIRIQTLKDTKELELSFPIPSMFPYWQTKPESILSHLLGHEGKGSLFSLLKKENLASAIVASTHSTSFAGSFDVDITMTDYGQKNIDKIVSHFFSYIEMLNKNGYKKYIYDEESTMRSINFVYRDHQEGVWVASKFANLMQKYPPLEIEKAQALLQEYGPQDFSMLLSHIKPANMILFEQGKDVKTDKTEHFFKTKYAINMIPSKRIKKWEAAKLNKTLSYPQQNPFIPKDLALYKTQDTKPKNIINAKWGEFWFQSDNKFHLPKASVELRLLTDKVNTSPSSKMLANLYSLALNRSLEEWKYPITLAGLSFNIQRIDRGISLQFSGYSENIPFLIESISKKLLLLDVDQKTFEDIKSELKRMVINSYKAPAYQQAIYHLRYLADSKMIHPKYYFQPSGLPGSIDLISDVTLKQVRENAKKVLSRFAIEGAAYGNLKEQEVKTALLSLPKNLKASPLPAELRGRSLALKLDQEKASLLK